MTAISFSTNPHQVRIDELRAQIADGDYEVDPHAVADALVRRLSAGAGSPPAGPERPSS